MRANDKIYCTNTLVYLGITYLIKDKIYKIISIDENYIYVSCESPVNIPIRFNHNAINRDEYKLNHYFMQPKKLRKLKLEKLQKKPNKLP